MNERIQQLVKQATTSAHRCQGFNGDPTYVYPGQLDVEKLAELLIAECISVIQAESMNSGDQWEDGLIYAENAIKLHFGVQ